MSSLNELILEIRSCRACEADLPLGPRPILAATSASKILIVGQAPGLQVHESGIPWNDASGQRLRDWMGIQPDVFYDETKIAIVPMGFCYPGSGLSGDLPPRPECAQLWHERLFAHLKDIKLTLVIGSYAQAYCFKSRRKENLTKTVESWKEFTPKLLPMPHPSPRNNRWLKKNTWFESDVVPYLRKRVTQLLK